MLRHGVLSVTGRPGRDETIWELTGNRIWRTGWFGRADLYVEEVRLVFRPIYTGYTPANWQEQRRWRRARVADLGSLSL
jgi:hypothetical protein